MAFFTSCWVSLIQRFSMLLNVAPYSYLTLHLIFPSRFYAKPMKNPDGSIDIMHWECGIPGAPKVSHIHITLY